MIRSLIRLYFLVVIAVAAAVITIDTTFSILFHDQITRTARESLRGYAFAVSQYLERYEGQARTEAIDKMSRNSHEQFQLLSVDALTNLNAKQRQDLRDGKLVLGSDINDYYLPLSDGQIVHAHDRDVNNTSLEVTAYLIVALATLLSVVGWVWYHWRDLYRLQESARQFGNGKLGTRAVLPKKSSIFELAQQFNVMAEQIQASILQQREMMHGISHELKTPIARLEFGIALLQSPPPPPRDAREEDAQRQRHTQRLEALHKDVRELDELVTELLTLGQLEQGAAPMAVMQVSLAELLDSVAASVADEVAERGLALTVRAAAPRAHHVCDPRLVARALQNLIRNATRYARSTITVDALSRTDGMLSLVIEDDGPGIPAADRARIFEPFLRLDSSRDRHTGGFGLGLAIVHRIAAAHGGTATVGSSATGGARFEIILPAMPAPATPSRDDG